MNELSSKSIRFYLGLLEAFHGGLSPLAAVECVGEATLLPEVRLMLKSRLRRGEALSESMRRHSETFPSWQSAIMQVGETTGRLDRSCAMIVEILESRRALWLSIAAASAAPLLLLHLSAIITHAPLLVSGGLGTYLTALLKTLARIYVPLAALGLCWPRLKQSRFAARFRRFNEKHLFCACLSSLVRAGIGIAQSIAIAASAVGRDCPPDWESRETMTERLRGLGILSQEDLGLLNVAEISGTIDAALLHIAERTRRDWKGALRSQA